MVGHERQTREYILQVSVRVEAATSAAFAEGENDSAALSGLCLADKKRSFLADGGGADGTFIQVVVDLVSQRSKPASRERMKQPF